MRRSLTIFHRRVLSGVLWLVTALAGISTSCLPKVAVDSEEGSLPVIELDLTRKIVPFPNNLIIGDDGRVALPPQCQESAALRDIRLALNKLDGFGNHKPQLRFSVSEAPDEESFTDRVYFACRSVNGEEQAPSAMAVQSLDLTFETVTRFDADCFGFRQVHQLTAEPTKPLGEESTCVVAVVRKDGDPLTEKGVPFGPSPTWTLLRQRTPPVELEDGKVVANHTPLDGSTESGRKDLVDLRDVWDDHQPALEFMTQSLALAWLGPDATPIPREDVLLAWEFTTQRLSLPFDPSVPESLYSRLAETADTLTEAAIVTTDQVTTDQNEIWDRFAEELDADATGVHPCELAPCDAVSAIVEGHFLSPNYQGWKENPGGLDGDVPDVWNDPLAPTVNQETPVNDLYFVAFAPDPVSFPGPNPVVISMVGTGGTTSDLFVLSPHLAAQGLISVTIDWPVTGTRAVPVEDSAAAGCSDSDLTYRDNPGCYTFIFSSQLDWSRDNLRQGMLDVLQLLRVLKRCASSGCGTLNVDADRIGYLGQSQGSYQGAILAGIAPEIRAAVLNVGGTSWVDGFVDGTLSWKRCFVIDALIGMGVVAGQLSYGGSNPGALCLSSDNSWKRDPNVREFISMARWLMDPADPVNFAGLLRQRIESDEVRVLLQEVLYDDAVPNYTTADLAHLLGLGQEIGEDGRTTFTTAAFGNVLLPGLPAASPEIDGLPEDNRVDNPWLGYVPLGPQAGLPGNRYYHSSIYGGATDEAALLGTARIRADAIGFLRLHLSP